MKKLHWFILKSYIGPFILTFFISLFLLLMQFLWRYVDELVGKGLELSVIGELLFYFSLSLMPMALPLATLLASLMTFGNLGENYELLSLKAAGISLQKTMQSIIIFTILVSIGAFFFANNVLPVANLKGRSLFLDIKSQKPEMQIKTGVFNNDLADFSIRIEERNPETKLLKKIRIYDHREEKGNINVTVADSGYMEMTEDEKNLRITLYNGNSYDEEGEDKKRNRKNKTYRHRREEFKERQITIALSGFGLNRSDESLYKSDVSMLNLSQLRYFQDSLAIELQKIHSKYNTNLVNTSYFKKRNIKTSTVKTNIDSLRVRSNLNPGSRIKNVSVQDIMETRNVTTVKLSEENVIKKEVAFNYYQAFDSLEGHNKTEVVFEAISNARDTKTYIENNNVNLTSNIRKLARYKIEWHRKLTLSFACFIFFFIGAPLGAIIRKGGLGMPVIISVLFFIVYYIITISTEKLAKEGIISPFWGMWIASMILLPAGIFLTYKATTDSVILNVETYTVFFKKIFNIRAKNLSDTETLSTKIFDEKLSPQETLTQVSEFNEKCRDFYIRVLDNLTIKNIFKNKVTGFKKELESFAKYYYGFYSLLTVQNYMENKQIQSLTRELPTLEISEYNFLFINRNLGIFLSVFFPLGLLYYVLFISKLWSLKRRFYKINEITKSITKSLENPSKRGVCWANKL